MREIGTGISAPLGRLRLIVLDFSLSFDGEERRTVHIIPSQRGKRAGQ